MKASRSKPNPSARQKLGNAGERLARAHLTSLGYQIIYTNWHCSYGELDIVAWHAQCLVFIEVRTRSSVTGFSPEETITPAKKERLLLLTQAFIQAEPGLLEQPGTLPPCRIDLVAVQFGEAGRLLRLEVIENAVQPE